MQRIGRTGRVGNLGRATSFFDKKSKDAKLAKDLVKVNSSLFIERYSNLGIKIYL